MPYTDGGDGTVLRCEAPGMASAGFKAGRKQACHHNSLCSMAYFTSSAREVILSFCINRAL